MDFQEVIRRRRMVRRFTGEPVGRSSLDRILGNAVRGPSAGFCQGQAFLVLAGGDPARFWAVREEFTISADHEPIGAIAIGHAADAEPDRLARRRPLAEMVHYGQWLTAARLIAPSGAAWPG